MPRAFLGQKECGRAGKAILHQKLGENPGNHFCTDGHILYIKSNLAVDVIKERIVALVTRNKSQLRRIITVRRAEKKAFVLRMQNRPVLNYDKYPSGSN